MEPNANHRPAALPPTRGNGLLEPLLARLRVRRANALIPDRLRDGRILDIGCGSYPYFLAHSLFREKYGIDQGSADHFPDDVRFFSQNLNAETKLPYEDRYFECFLNLWATAQRAPDT